MVLQADIDLLNPPAEVEQRKHKLKRLVQSPNSFFMDVKCPGCFQMCASFTCVPLRMCPVGKFGGKVAAEASLL